MHSKFALRRHHVWKYGRHPISTAEIRWGKKDRWYKSQGKNIMACRITKMTTRTHREKIKTKCQSSDAVNCCCSTMLLFYCFIKLFRSIHATFSFQQFSVSFTCVKPWILTVWQFWHQVLYYDCLCEDDVKPDLVLRFVTCSVTQLLCGMDTKLLLLIRHRHQCMYSIVHRTDGKNLTRCYCQFIIFVY